MIKRVCDVCGDYSGNISFKAKRRITSPGLCYTHPNSSWVKIDMCEKCYNRITKASDQLSFRHVLSVVIQTIDHDLLDTEDPDIKMTPKAYQTMKKLRDDLMDIF